MGYTWMRTIEGQAPQYLELDSLASRRLEQSGWQEAGAVAYHQTVLEIAPEFFPGTDVRRMARRIKEVCDTLLRAGVHQSHLETIRSQNVRRWIECALAIQKRLAAKKQYAKAGKIRLACQLDHEPIPVTVAGFPRVFPEEAELIDAIAGPGSEWYFPLADHRWFEENREQIDSLRQRGWQVVEERFDPETLGQRMACQFVEGGQTTQAHLRAYHDIEAEARGTLAEIKQRLLEGVSPADIAIASRQESIYGLWLMSIADEYEVPVNVFYQTPLAQTRLGAWISLLLRVLRDGFPYEPTIWLLQNPLTVLKGKHGIWRQAALDRTEGRRAWSERAPVLTDFDQHTQRTRKAWIKAWQHFLKQLGAPHAVQKWPREACAWVRYEEALGQLAQYDSGADLSWTQFERDLTDLLSLIMTPVKPGRGGIELHSPVSLRGARVRHLFVLGMMEGYLPAAYREEPVLDFHLRDQLRQAGLHLERADETAPREALAFWSLLQAADSTLSLSWCQYHQGKELLPSPYLDRLNLENEQTLSPKAASLIEWRRCHLANGSAVDDPVLVQAQAACQAERSRLLSPCFDEHDGFTGASLDIQQHVFSPSQLTELGQCPFRWYARSVLKLGPPDEKEAEPDAAIRGSICHEVLQRAVVDARNQPNFQEALLACLPMVFDQVATEKGLHRYAAWPSRRAEWLGLLQRAVQGGDFMQDGAQALECERKIEGQWHGLKVRGIIDRIDQMGEQYWIVDYKTSSQKPAGIQNEEGENQVDLQLSIYQSLLNQQSGYEDKPSQAYYYLLPTVKKEKLQLDAQAHERFVAQVKTMFARGQFPVRPDREMKSCTYCDFEALCRKGPRLAHKTYSITETDDAANP